MSFSVYFSIQFRCDDNDPLAKIAKDYYNLYEENKEDSYDCMLERRFLKSLSERIGTNIGRNGGLCFYGEIGNYLVAENFVDELKEFWLDLYKQEIIPGYHRIIIFKQTEADLSPKVIQVYLDRAKQLREKKYELIINSFDDLPFEFTNTYRNEEPDYKGKYK